MNIVWNPLYIPFSFNATTAPLTFKNVINYQWFFCLCAKIMNWTQHVYLDLTGWARPVNHHELYLRLVRVKCVCIHFFMYPRHVQIHIYHLMHSRQACSLSYLPGVVYCDADNGSIAILDPMQVLFFATSVRLKKKHLCKIKKLCTHAFFFGAINRLSVNILIMFWLVKRMKNSLNSPDIKEHAFNLSPHSDAPPIATHTERIWVWQLGDKAKNDFSMEVEDNNTSSTRQVR